MYYKYLGMQKAESYSEEEIIELLIINKKDLAENKIDFKWIHSREFRYNGEMYDVVKKEEDDKYFFFHCINDEKEKRLGEEFEKRVNDNSANSKHQQRTSNHFNILISEPVQNEDIDITLVYECIFNQWITEKYYSIQLDIPSPPPRIT